MLKRSIILLLIVPLFLSFTGKPSVIKADDLVKRFNSANDTTYVINFWATWCGPCIKELPDFERLNQDYNNKKVKVILVSLDFLSDYNSRLLPFLKKKKIQSEVVLLNETKPEEFINKISRKWQGSLPSTMIINNSKKYSEFFEDALTYSFLVTKVNALTD